jgi:signal transduction histidine kinase/lysophospholipase L1-like esterase
MNDVSKDYIARGALIFSFVFGVVGLILLTLTFLAEDIHSRYSFISPVFIYILSCIGIISISLFIWVREERLEILKYEFVNIVTHKFRTPLTYIKWSVENLKKEQSPSQKAESVRQIESAEERLTEMTDIMIGMAKVDDGSSYVFRAESFRDIVEEVIIAHAQRIKEKSILLNIDLAYGLPLISIDVKRIQFVIKTLLENAILYTPNNGSINIAAGLYGANAIRFAISDNGMGVRKEDFPHIFTKFFRSKDATLAYTEGMGLGLFISKNIIERHNGKMWFESDGEGRGANNAGSSAFGGEIAEVIRTTGSLTAADTAAIEAYLLRRYPSAPKIGWTIRDMMACGDSLTVGAGSTDGRGWRPYVRAAFESQDIEAGVQTLRFCGPTRDRCMSTYAASGRVIATIRDGIAAQLAAYSPNCLVICVGTNDCQGDDGAYNAITTPQKLMDTMTNIDTAGFTGRIVLCLIPQQNNVTNNANVTDFNEAITEAGGIYDDSIALGLDVTLCDLNTGLDPATYMVDGVHFNDTGYAAAATRITAAIRAAYAP